MCDIQKTAEIHFSSAHLTECVTSEANKSLLKDRAGPQLLQCSDSGHPAT